MRQTHRLIHYLRHILTATNTGGHGVHSPFLFEFIQYVLKEKYPFYCFEVLEKKRLEILSGISPNPQDSARKNQLLFRICARYKLKNVMEVGTSPGISTLYLTTSDQTLKCTRVEIHKDLSKKVQMFLHKEGRTNFDQLPVDSLAKPDEVLQRAGVQDLIYISAIAPASQLIYYFDSCVNFCNHNSIIVIDKPYESEEATVAWKTIQKRTNVYATIDLYHLGIVFFNPAYAHTHYRSIF